MKRKKLKGMTLMEIIIAMAVLIIVAGILVESAVVVINNIRISKNVVNTVNIQAPETENHQVVDSYDTAVLELRGASLTPADLTIDKYQATVTLPADSQRSGNLKYFLIVTD